MRKKESKKSIGHNLNTKLITLKKRIILYSIIALTEIILSTVCLYLFNDIKYLPPSKPFFSIILLIIIVNYWPIDVYISRKKFIKIYTIDLKEELYINLSDKKFFSLVSSFYNKAFNRKGRLSIIAFVMFNILGIYSSYLIFLFPYAFKSAKISIIAFVSFVAFVNIGVYYSLVTINSLRFLIALSRINKKIYNTSMELNNKSLLNIKKYYTRIINSNSISFIIMTVIVILSPYESNIGILSIWLCIIALFPIILLILFSIIHNKLLKEEKLLRLDFFEKKIHYKIKNNKLDEIEAYKELNRINKLLEENKKKNVFFQKTLLTSLVSVLPIIINMIRLWLEMNSQS